MTAYPLHIILLLSVALIAVTPASSKPVQTSAPPEQEASEEDGATEQPAREVPVQLSAEEVTAFFLSSYAVVCTWGIEQSGGTVEPEMWNLTYRYESDEADSPDRPLALYRYFCNSGAYNEQHIYLTVDEYGEIRPLEFAEPQLDIVYEGPELENSAVESITVTGFIATAELTNSTYDPETDSIVTYALGRGIGDAFSSATYARDKDQFVLKTYDIDATYDGEQTPERVVDYTGEVQQ